MALEEARPGKTGHGSGTCLQTICMAARRGNLPIGAVFEKACIQGKRYFICHTYCVAPILPVPGMQVQPCINLPLSCERSEPAHHMPAQLPLSLSAR